MKKNLVLTVGNGMMGDDGAGPLLASMLQQAPLPDWEVLSGGAVPENVLHLVRDLAPERVLLVDAADMDLHPGAIRHIPDERLEDPFLLTTHSLPLSYLIEALREFIPRVELLGIQPDLVAFGFPISEQVKQAVGRVYSDLSSGKDAWDCL